MENVKPQDCCTLCPHTCVCGSRRKGVTKDGVSWPCSCRAAPHMSAFPAIWRPDQTCTHIPDIRTCLCLARGRPRTARGRPQSNREVRGGKPHSGHPWLHTCPAIRLKYSLTLSCGVCIYKHKGAFKPTLPQSQLFGTWLWSVWGLMGSKGGTTWQSSTCLLIMINIVV